MRASLSNIHSLQCMVTEKHKEAAALKVQIDNALETIGEEKKKILNLMKDMDIASSGNYGWEGRVLWALTELVSQATAYAREHP